MDPLTYPVLTIFALVGIFFLWRWHRRQVQLAADLAHVLGYLSAHISVFRTGDYRLVGQNTDDRNGNPWYTLAHRYSPMTVKIERLIPDYPDHVEFITISRCTFLGDDIKFETYNLRLKYWYRKGKRYPVGPLAAGTRTAFSHLEHSVSEMTRQKLIELQPKILED
jgi:hypothetical protein